MVGCTRVPVKVPVYVMNTILASMSIVHMVIHICMDFDIYLIDL
jgi:hypothetical protein